MQCVVLICEIILFLVTVNGSSYFYFILTIDLIHKQKQRSETGPSISTNLRTLRQPLVVTVCLRIITRRCYLQGRQSRCLQDEPWCLFYKYIPKLTEKCRDTEIFDENPPFSPLQLKCYQSSCL